MTNHDARKLTDNEIENVSGGLVGFDDFALGILGGLIANKIYDSVKDSHGIQDVLNWARNH